jgi:hypothetical protein
MPLKKGSSKQVTGEKARKPKKAAGGGAMKKPKGAFMMVKRRDADQKTAIY